MGMSINEFNTYVREQRVAPKWQTISPNTPTNFPPVVRNGASREPLGFQRSGGSSTPQSTTSAGRLSVLSPSEVAQLLSDGKTIDMSPNGWGMFERMLRSAGISAAVRLANMIMKNATRRMLPLQLIEIAARILDELYKRRHQDQGQGSSIRPDQGWTVDSGWTIIGQCPDASTLERQWPGQAIWPPPPMPAFAGQCNACLGGQGGGYDLAYSVPTWTNIIAFGDRKNQTVPNRWRMVLAVVRPLGGTWPGAPNPRYVGGFVGAPFEFPSPLPLKYAARLPLEWPQSREVGSGADLLDDMVNTVEQWEFGGGKGPPSKTVVESPFPDRLPPPPNRKEKKIALSLAGNARRIVDWTTEGRDFLNSLWDAIPTKGPAARTRKYWKFGYKQPWSVPLPEKMFQIWRYWAHLEASGGWKTAEGQKYLSNAFANVFADNIKDFVYGQIGRTAGRASRRLGRPVGVQTGPVF